MAMSSDWVVKSWKLVQLDQTIKNEIWVMWAGEPGEGVTPISYDLEGKVTFFPSYGDEVAPPVPQEILDEAKQQLDNDAPEQGAFEF